MKWWLIAYIFSSSKIINKTKRFLTFYNLSSQTFLLLLCIHTIAWVRLQSCFMFIMRNWKLLSASQGLCYLPNLARKAKGWVDWLSMKHLSDSSLYFFTNIMCWWTWLTAFCRGRMMYWWERRNVVALKSLCKGW